jgi:hypothetical protein
VSGGNYFRKNADGSDGDDVSSMYSDDDRTISTPPENEFDSDYDKARADHPGFDRMMQRGMQNYLARGSVNDLVGFLNNPDNDNVFKSQVLNTITNRGDMENGPFASFQDALAVTRRQGNESIFDKFDKLPLQEQLRIVSKSKVLEGTRCWKGYKKKGMKTMFGKRVPNCVKNEADVSQLKPQTSGTKRPLFSPQRSQKAYEEWLNGAAVDTDIEIIGNDNQKYLIRQNTDGDSQHFKDDAWYLTDANYDPVDFEGYEDPEDLLFSHSATGYEPIDPEQMDENIVSEGVKETFAKLKQALSTETGETKEMMDVYKRALKNQASSEEINTANKQFKDVLKIVGLTTFVAGTSMIPGSGPALFPIEKYLNTKGISILPNGFKDAFPQALPKSLHKVGDKVTLDGATYDVQKVDANTGTVDVKDQSGKVWTKVKSTTFFKQVPENFADGKVKGKSRPGRVKKAGASCKGSVTSLRKKAKDSSGEKAKMYHWCANMKGGKKKS